MTSDRPLSSRGASSEAFWREYAPDEPIVHPDRIGPYEIERVLGEGGFGVVYLARQSSPQRAVALKIIRPGLASARTLRRFELEAEILGRLQHPGIAQIYEAGNADFGYGPQPFVAMEYVRGLPLTSYNDKHSLSQRQKVRLLIELCEAVQHAHQKGVVHRDLSPANILVDEAGRPRVVDFGVARVAQGSLDRDTRHTEVGQFVGTVPYMSPEQISGRPDEVDARTDVYTLGVVAFELLTGELPHDVRGRSLPDAARIICEEAPPLAGQRRASLRGDLETILASSLAKERERRYGSAAGLGSDLSCFLNDVPIAARPASAAYQLRKFARRHRGLVAGLAAATLFLLAAVVGTSIGFVRASHAENALQGRHDDTLRQLDFLLDTYLETLIPQIGSGALQRPLLDNARERIESLLEEQPRDARLRAKLARTLAAQGVLEAEEGNEEAGLELQHRALSLYGELAEDDPTDIEAWVGVSIAMVRIGDVLQRRGDTDRALELYSDSLALDLELRERKRDNPRLADNLCWSYARIGNLLWSAGERARAEQYFRDRHAIALELQDSDPEELKALFNLCDSFGFLSRVERAAQNFELAATYAHESLALAKRLVKAERDVLLYQRYLASSYSVVARAEHERGHEADSVSWHRNGIRIKRDLCLRDPSDEHQLLAAARSYRALASLLVRLDRVDEAVELWRDMIYLGDELGERDAPALCVARARAWGHSGLVQLGGADACAAHVGAAQEEFELLCSLPQTLPEDWVPWLEMYDEQAAFDPGMLERVALRALEHSGPRAGFSLTLARALLALERPADALSALDRIGPWDEDKPYAEARNALRTRCLDAQPQFSKKGAPGDE